MPRPTPCPRLPHPTANPLAPIRLIGALLAVGLGLVTPPLSPPVRAQAALTLGLTASDTALGPGDTLSFGVSVDNPGGGPSADFYVLIVLPDGSTVVSVGPGVGARFGTVSNLRSFVPVARGVNLAGAFPYAANPFFSYTFGGSEPVGTYRVFFVATRSGAFGDGRIDGGDLLAVATEDVTFALGPSATADTSRTAAATVTPSAGGTVQTTAANGTQLSLAVPAGGVGLPTTISIAPLTGVANLDAGPLVAGISAQPAGLKFPTAATLTITLPAGFVAPPFGLRGFIFDDDGSDLRFLPVQVTGNVATMVVPHFSAAGLVVNDQWFRDACANQPSAPLEQLIACQRIFPLYQAEVQRLASQGGPLDLVFKFDVMAALMPWMQNGLIPRATAAQTPDAAAPFDRASRVDDEWSSWFLLWDVWGDRLSDRQNQANGLALGDLIDQFQDQYWRALLAAQQAGNAKCLTDRANFAFYVENVGNLGLWWTLQGLNTIPWAQQFCANLEITGSAPAVLTSAGAPITFSVVLKFTDGIEVSATPARDVVLTITATNATVRPAGGTRPLPIHSLADVTLTPNPGETSSVVTITAALLGDDLAYLPVRSLTLTAGNGQVNLPVTQSLIRSTVDMLLPGWATRWVRYQSSTIFEPSARSAMDQPSTSVTVAQGTFTGQNLSETSRDVVTTGRQTVVTASGRLAPALTIQPIFGFGVSRLAEVVAIQNQYVCFDLPERYSITYSAQSSAPGAGTFNFAIDNAPPQNSGAVTVNAGEHCVYLHANVRCSNKVSWSTVGCEAQGPVTWSYTATLQPLP